METTNREGDRSTAGQSLAAEQHGKVNETSRLQKGGESSNPNPIDKGKSVIDEAAKETYADKVGTKKAYTRMQLNFIPPEKINGKAVVRVPHALTVAGVEKWKYALIGYVLGLNPTYRDMSLYVRTRWQTMGNVELHRLSSGIFIFNFISEEAKMEALEQGPWSFSRRPLILRPWTPGMSLAKKAVETLPIWIQFPHLSLDLWNPESLSMLASHVGKPLFADRSTSEMTRFSFARVCVEINTKSELLETIPIEYANGYTVDQKVEYEWRPQKCDKCKMFGHMTERCPGTLLYVVKQNSHVIHTDSTSGVKDSEGNENVEIGKANTVKEASPAAENGQIQVIEQWVEVSRKGDKNKETTEKVHETPPRTPGQVSKQGIHTQNLPACVVAPIGEGGRFSTLNTMTELEENQEENEVPPPIYTNKEPNSALANEQPKVNLSNAKHGDKVKNSGGSRKRRKRKGIWRIMLQKLQLYRTTMSWDAEREWCINKFSGSGFKSSLGRLVLGCTVYMLWQERNRRTFQLIERSKDQIIYQILQIVVEKASSWRRVKRNKSNFTLCVNWGISSCIFGRI